MPANTKLEKSQNGSTGRGQCQEGFHGLRRLWAGANQQPLLLKRKRPGACGSRSSHRRNPRDHLHCQLSVVALQSQQHITARGEQRHIALAEKHHAPTLLHLMGEGCGGSTPGIQEWLGLRHHGEHQGKTALGWIQKELHNGRGHACGIQPGHRVSNHLGSPQAAVGLQREQLRITRADSDQHQRGRRGRIRCGGKTQTPRGNWGCSKSARCGARLNALPEPA